MRRVSVGILACVAVVARVHAGEPAVVETGSRVRVTSSANGQLSIGTVAAIEPDVLVLRREGLDSTLRIPIAELRSLELSRGKQSQAKRGAIVGAAIGAMPGVLITVGDYSEDVHGDSPSPFAVAAMGAAGGAAIGAAIGWAVKAERWVPAELQKASVAVVPLRGGVGFTLRIAWGGSAGTGRSSDN